MTTRPTTRLVQSQKLRLNTGLTTAIKVLRYDSTGLTRYLEEQAAENPYLALGPVEPAPGEWLPRWTGAFAGKRPSGEAEVDLGSLIESPAPSLIAHVTGQINAIVPPGRNRDIAEVLVHALEPSGWLGRPLAVLASEAGASLPEAEAVLKLLQQTEPIGLFARSLSECLTLQAQETGCYDPIMACILNHLDLLAAGELTRLATLCGVSTAEISARLRQIRSFDPKPGAQFDQGAAPVREPDLTARRADVGWTVALNRSSLPDLIITTPKGAPASADDRLALANARALERVIASRNETLLRIAREILTRQELALERGLEWLVPLTMAEVARTLALHESTVSRAVAGVSVDIPRGTLWLRSLFSTATAEGGQAAGAIRARMVRIVANENPLRPLSDQALANALSDPDVPIARRTIAKYRYMLNIPIASRRKRIQV